MKKERTMKRTIAFAVTVLLFVGTLPVFAQDAGNKDEEKKQEFQYFRPFNYKGLNIFEPPKFDKQPKFNGMFSKIGFAVTQQVQNLKHENTAVGADQLDKIGLGANLASANFYLHAQLADGIRFMTTGYASSRHHNEFWWKDGYIQIDKIPLDHPLFNVLSAMTRVKVGHMEINYGDAHFRRSDNGFTNMNPFVGNYVLDAFTTEIAAEGYFYLGRNASLMVSMTGAELKGNIQNRQLSKPAFVLKGVFDKHYSDDLRFRVSYSTYQNASSPANTLYSGNRAGSRYYGVTEPLGASYSTNFRSGHFNPDFSNAVAANVVNPFVSYKGLEFFGVVEWANGMNFKSDKHRRNVNQLAGDIIYRFESLGMNTYVATRYNVVNGELQGILNDVNINRWAFATGAFITPNVLLKIEYVNQKYRGYPVNNILHGARFNGLVLESGISF